MAFKSCTHLSSKGAISSLGALALCSPRSWLASFARQSILSALTSAISVGYLIVDDAEGSHAYGFFKKGCNHVHIKVKSDNFWLRLILSGDLGSKRT
ncbi:uncharacterized protein BT62DRAFT_1006190 [Guyanagaster necrorhizus]|uniref:Uncharacterized protein n=1 Tax=Guyanagaster necrorhizus TaxID=856835 RepID=A0A9P8AS40_9AGAR|nr:uncharacterized protein BT62DRAFT_1006190 [Guyanagaster necrorhizus MCA 3950]KAG7446013.1 hypothetical protein BT62DRAFT_1006190 [Guyanagaster necrorhizus MCA 3950]